MKSNLGDKERLIHILECIILIEEFTVGVDYPSYNQDLKLRLALVKLLETIGEAAGFVSSELKNEFDEVDWRVLKAVRNLLIHEYFGINYEIVWESIRNDIPPLKEKVNHILKKKFPAP
ncbi:DUF86 domain-containing protein [Telluribacter sp.]|jgi:uncharacterized protein with HEPN domain|uniref:HepT-like ribonuclease domain-containing protein n=1 Tax=Telluribacter sp. TaxID=1978767 RepID=UPI002E158C21|nr:HepT-like ribonuclease domain-containing protein [Telluribacter sp.]